MASTSQNQLNALAKENLATQGLGVLVFTHQRDQGMVSYHTQIEYEKWDKDSPWPEGGTEFLLFKR